MLSPTEAERRTRAELTKESRTLLAKTAKKLDVQREVTRLTKNPAAGMMVRQLLFFDDKKKVCDDYWIFKSAKQWEQDEGLTRQQVRTATRKLEDFGLAQVDRDRRDPLYNNTTTFYRLDIYRVMQVVDPVKLGVLEPELRYLEPEYDEAADGFHDEDAPDLTDEDAPDPIGDVDWLPEGFVATDDEATNNQPLPQNQPTPMRESTNPLVESTNPMYRGSTTEEVRQKNHKQRRYPLAEGREARSRLSIPDQEDQEKEVATDEEKPTSEQVRALLGHGGSLRPLAETVVAEGCAKTYVELLVPRVAHALKVEPEDCHALVVDELKRLAMGYEREVA